MNEDIELIKHAAVKTESGMMMIGKHHADCFHKGFNIGLKMEKKADSQGFITSKGRFVTRKEAGVIAKLADQIDKVTHLLFSEDMWCDKYMAKHNYDEVKGYVLR